MNTSVLTFAYLVFACHVAAQSQQSFANEQGQFDDACPGQFLNQYCCVGGNFVGPVYASVTNTPQTSLATGTFTKTGAHSASTSSLFTGVPSTITTEIIPGLTCIGQAVSTLSVTGIYESIVLVPNTSSAFSGTSTSASATSPSATVASSVTMTATSSQSSNFAPMVTQAPILVAGAAAAFAYGAM